MSRYILIITLGVIFVSCNKADKTVADIMQKEKEAIEALIAKEGFEIINSFPDNGVFGKNQFLLLDNGCYLNIIDSGNGNRAVHGETIVLMRCGLTFMSASDDDVPFSIVVDYSDEPVKFTYGDAYNATMNADKNNPAYTILSPGIESALKYISESAVLRMIIPSLYDANHDGLNSGGTGSAYQYMSLSPMYYEEIMIEFESDD